MFTKDDILKEIKRTAKENGGTPLGRGRFEKETGIKPYEWGKYWARLGDAQKEAGFTANTLLAGYDEDYMLEKFAKLSRELKRIPAYGDLRVKHSNDSSYPDAATFARLGAKHIFLAKLLKYAKEKRYDDVALFSQIALENEHTRNSDDESKLNLEIGSVYLLRSGKFYKIGRTNSMGRRHHEITILLPDGAELIHEIKTDDPSGVENYWHKRFEDKRKNGEWFDLNSSDVKAFRRWRKII